MLTKIVESGDELAVVIPKHLAYSLGLRPGQTVEVDTTRDGRVELDVLRGREFVRCVEQVKPDTMLPECLWAPPQSRLPW